MYVAARAAQAWELCVAQLRTLRQCVRSFCRCGLLADGGRRACQDASTVWARAARSLIVLEVRRLGTGPPVAWVSWARSLGFSEEVASAWAVGSSGGASRLERREPIPMGEI